MSLVKVTTTISTKEDAQKLSKEAIEKKLAFCVQIEGPLLSMYRWNGRLQEDSEWKCSFKSLESKKGALIRFLLDCHPYDTPEIITEAITSENQAYTSWASTSVSSDEASSNDC